MFRKMSFLPTKGIFKDFIIATKNLRQIQQRDKVMGYVKRLPSGDYRIFIQKKGSSYGSGRSGRAGKRDRKNNVSRNRPSFTQSEKQRKSLLRKFGYLPGKDKRRLPSTAAKQYRRFHGTSPRKVTGVRFSMPRYLVKLGRAGSVSYVPDRSSTKQTVSGRKTEYIHKFGREVFVYATPDKKSIIIMGGNFRVTDWMRG